MKCPFCDIEMSDLGVSLQPVSMAQDEQRTVNVVSHVWRGVHEYWCHGCGFIARFIEEYHKKYIEEYPIPDDGSIDMGPPERPTLGARGE